MASFISVAKVSDIPKGKMKIVTVNNHDIVIANVNEQFYAFDNTCPHREGQLGDGSLFGTTVVCPLHQWDFDVRTGVSDYNPRDKIATYVVKKQGTNIQVDADTVPSEGPKMEYLSRWKRYQNETIEPDMDFIHKLSKGMTFVSPMGTSKKVPGFEYILFAPAQLDRLPLLDNEEVDSRVVIGKKAKKPLILSLPIMASHMSFGALSKEAKIAIAKGTAAVGTAMGSGEGGLLPESREFAKQYIFEMASGYFGWTEENIKKADAIEIKIGQSAKPGLGGLLPGKKVTEDIAKVRGIKAGQPIQSPSRFPDINTKQQLKERVTWIKKVNGGKPVGIKFAAGHVEKDIDVALYAGADFITIDGRGGGTGAAESFIKDSFAVPLVYALQRARKHLDNTPKGKDVSLIATGRIRTPMDVLKCLAMGADAAYLATGVMMAIGCQQYRACNNDSCPVGIATQREDLRTRFDVDKSAKLLENFLNGSNKIMKKITMALGKKKLSDVSVDDLFTTDSEISSHTDIRHAGY